MFKKHSITSSFQFLAFTKTSHCQIAFYQLAKFYVNIIFNGIKSATKKLNSINLNIFSESIVNIGLQVNCVHANGFECVDKLNEDNLVEFIFAKRYLNTWFMQIAGFKNWLLKYSCKWITFINVKQYDCADRIVKKKHNFFYKNQKKNLLVTNTVVIGKNTS